MLRRVKQYTKAECHEERGDRMKEIPKAHVANRPGGARVIVEVARRASVSPSTVSRVTNGTKPVKPELAKRVWEAIRELGYVPNPSARALVSGRSRVLGLLVTEITNPFFPELIRSFEDVAITNGYEVLIGSSNFNAEHAKLFVRRLAQRRAEGVAVLTFRRENTLLEELVRHNVPLVTVDEKVLGALRSGVLEIDYNNGISAAVNHLIQLGHTRIAFACGPSPYARSTHRLRQKAFLDALAQAGVPTSPNHSVTFPDTMEGGVQAAQACLDMPIRPTALLCSNDFMALGALRQFAEKRLRVPEEMSVIGFDDIHIGEFTTPALTTVRMSKAELAESAFSALQRLGAHKEGSLHLRAPISTQLVIRETTAQCMLP